MKTTAETVKEGAKLLQQGLDLLRGGPLTFYLDDLTGAVDYLMDRFCPVKEGDRVELIEAPEISATVSWGLLPYKHFLVAGAQGVVKSVECGRKGIRVYLEFDNQSWLDREGREQPLDKPRQFCFADAELRTLPAGVARLDPLPEGPSPLAISEALHEAAAAIYFADSSDYLPALWSVVRNLAPGIAELLEKHPSAAYHTTDAERDRLRAAGVAPAEGSQQP